jgi:NAD(P)-dependent dehydrogenase (short-subunit alcohol dehydrogenase family)
MIQTQKVAIITGASRGIGAGLVTAYRRLGYAVVATSRSVESTDPEVLAVTGNLSRPGTGPDVVEQALNRFGRIDTVVNDAGVFIAKAFTDYTDEDYDTVTGVNLRGFFDISRSAIAAMLAHGSGGHLVNVSTSLVDHANSQVPAALASLTKGGLTAATKSLAIEYAARGIRVNAVALGIDLAAERERR